MTIERANVVLRIYEKRFGGDLPFAYKPKWATNDQYKTFEEGITEEEHDFIKWVWSGMRGTASYLDAVKLIARGEAPTPTTAFN